MAKKKRRSPKRGITFRDDNDCPVGRRPITRGRSRRDFCRDVGRKKDTYEYYRTQNYYGCCRKKGSLSDQMGRLSIKGIPSKSVMKGMLKTDLEKLAKDVGLKQKGVGWSTCCGGSTKKHIINALNKFR